MDTLSTVRPAADEEDSQARAHRRVEALLAHAPRRQRPSDRLLVEIMARVGERRPVAITSAPAAHPALLAPFAILAVAIPLGLGLGLLPALPALRLPFALVALVAGLVAVVPGLLRGRPWPVRIVWLAIGLLLHAGGQWALLGT